MPASLRVASNAVVVISRLKTSHLAEQSSATSYRLSKKALKIAIFRDNFDFELLPTPTACQKSQILGGHI